MAYTAEKSGADVDKYHDALFVNFRYSMKSKFVKKSNYTAVEWENMLKAELDAGRPVMVGSEDHIYIVDGYQTSPTLKFHCNIGWGGWLNKFYKIDSVMLSGKNYAPINAIIGVKPLEHLETNSDTLNASTTGGLSTFKLASLKNWNITSNQSWCVPAVLSGTDGYGIYSTNISENLTYLTRFATMKIVSGTDTAFIVVKQSGKYAFLYASTSSLTSSSSGEALSVNITCDSSWTANSAESWINVVTKSGVGNSSVALIIAANSGASRTGKVIFTRGKSTSEVTVFQAASGSFWCVPSITKTSGNGITKVLLNDLSRTSVVNEGYVNTGESANLAIDSAYTLSVTFGGNNAPAVWIDWNMDGDFSDASEAVVAPSGSWYPTFSSTKTMKFTVPYSAAEGITRMRIYAKYFSTGPISGPCNTSDAGGDIEDYDVVVTKNITTEIKDLSSSISVLVFPNPSSNFFILSAEGFFTFALSDLNGKVVEQGSGFQNTFFGETISSGMYLLHITSGNESQVMKIVKSN